MFSSLLFESQTINQDGSRLLADLLHERRVRVSGGRLGELAGGEGALEGVVLVLDLLQLEVLPLRRFREQIHKAGPTEGCSEYSVLKPVQISRERTVLDRCELELSHEFYISALGD